MHLRRQTSEWMGTAMPNLDLKLDPEGVQGGGGIVWEAATVLSRFLAVDWDWNAWALQATANARPLRVLEIGSGTGASGLLAHAIGITRLPGRALHTVLTDAHTTTLIEHNIAANAVKLGPAGSVHAQTLDWEQLAQEASGAIAGFGDDDSNSSQWAGRWDLIIGSDITYGEGDTQLSRLLASLRHLCSSDEHHRTCVLLAHTHRDRYHGSDDGGDIANGSDHDGGAHSTTATDCLLQQLVEASVPGGSAVEGSRRGAQWSVAVKCTTRTGMDPNDVWSATHDVSIIELRASSSHKPAHAQPATAACNSDAWRFFRDVLGSPRYVAAPMVGCSILPWRLMVRRYGAQLCYTPMIDARRFLAATAVERDLEFCTEPHGDGDGLDRPLVAQLCARNADEFVRAAALVQSRVDAVCLNLGCPQQRARREGWGASLLDEPELACSIVSRAQRELRVPIFCKMRVQSAGIDSTVAYAIALQRAGCSLLTVHGRTREATHHDSPVDEDAIAAVVAALKVPVVANGGADSRAAAERLLQRTGAAAVMVANGLLADPALFGRSAAKTCVASAINAFELPSAALDAAREFLAAVSVSQRQLRGVCGSYDIVAGASTQRTEERFAEPSRDVLLQLFLPLIHPKRGQPARRFSKLAARVDGKGDRANKEVAEAYALWKLMASMSGLLKNRALRTNAQFSDFVELLAHSLHQPVRGNVKTWGQIKRGEASAAIAITTQRTEDDGNCAGVQRSAGTCAREAATTGILVDGTQLVLAEYGKPAAILMSSERAGATDDDTVTAAGNGRQVIDE